MYVKEPEINCRDKEHYLELRAKVYDYQSALRSKHGNRPTRLTPVQVAELGPSPTNAERSAVETWEFQHGPIAPDRYFAYVNEDTHTVTTWTGQYLGHIVKCGRVWRDNFGGKRQHLTVHAINGKTYYGTYYTSAGNYCRLRRKWAK
jgi:hypothetical protein